MSASVQTVRAKIERVIRRDPVMGTSADFFLVDSAGWLCCTAYILRDGLPDAGRIACRATPMMMAQAAIVGVAISMALDWLAEELTR